MRRPNRRQALLAVAAAGAGLAAGGVPELIRMLQPEAPSKRPTQRQRPPSPRRDPGYAHGPLQAIHRPVHSLHDLTPAAPPNAVALTIDDGPDPRWTPMALDLLAEHQVSATFCLIAEQVTQFPKLVERIVAAGHQICDHTVTHPLNLPGLATARMHEEIVGAHDRIAQTAGMAPKFFRAPGGNWSAQVMDTAAAHGMVCIDWQVDPRDWARPGTSSITRTMLGARAGDIILCHDGGGDRSETMQALRTVIPALKQRGLAFVAL
ncbi:MAG: polysaccharide deacetylase family protein [Actinoallomurus sp.]